MIGAIAWLASSRPRLASVTGSASRLSTVRVRRKAARRAAGPVRRKASMAVWVEASESARQTEASKLTARK